MIPLLSVLVLIGSCLLAYFTGCWEFWIYHLIFSLHVIFLRRPYLLVNLVQAMWWFFSWYFQRYFCLRFMFICVYEWVYEYSTDIGQERVFAFPRPELQAVVSHLVWLLEIGLSSSKRAVRALNNWAVCLASRSFLAILMVGI